MNVMYMMMFDNLQSVSCVSGDVCLDALKIDIASEEPLPNA